MSRAARREHMAREQLRSDISAVLAIPAGRRYLFELLNRGFLFESTWTGNSEIHRNEGMRIFALSIKDDIESVDPRLFIDVLSLRHADDSHREGVAEDERDGSD